MTAAIIALSLLALALGTALVFAVRWGITAKDEANAAGDLLRGTKDLVASQEIQIKSLSQQLAQAKTLAAIAQKQRNEAQSAERKRIADRIRTAKPDDAAKIVNDILAEPLTEPLAVVKPAPVVDIRTGGPIEELK